MSVTSIPVTGIPLVSYQYTSLDTQKMEQYSAQKLLFIKQIIDSFL